MRGPFSTQADDQGSQTNSDNHATRSSVRVVLYCTSRCEDVSLRSIILPHLIMHINCISSLSYTHTPTQHTHNTQTHIRHTRTHWHTRTHTYWPRAVMCACRSDSAPLVHEASDSLAIGSPEHPPVQPREEGCNRLQSYT